MARRIEPYLEARDGQRNIFAKRKFQKDFAKSQINDARVKHCFCGKLPNNMKDMGPLPKSKVST